MLHSQQGCIETLQREVSRSVFNSTSDSWYLSSNIVSWKASLPFDIQYDHLHSTQATLQRVIRTRLRRHHVPMIITDYHQAESSTLYPFSGELSLIHPPSPSTNAQGVAEE